MTGEVPQMLREAIHHDQFPDAVAIGATDLKPSEARQAMTRELHDGQAILVAPRVFGWRDPIVTSMQAQCGVGGLPAMPAQRGAALATP